MIKAVIFDMDGLMVDTEHLHYSAFAKVLNDLGIKYSVEDNKKYIGVSDIDESKDMISMYRLSLTAGELTRRKREVFKSLLNEIKPMKGLLELVNYLQGKGCKMAIASSSGLEIIQTIAKILNVEHFFEGYFSAEQVKNGKPAPDLFLKAAKKLKTNPKNCLVLEDAPKGVEAAIRAGIPVFAIPSSYTKDMDFKNASRVLDSLLDVRKYI